MRNRTEGHFRKRHTVSPFATGLPINAAGINSAPSGDHHCSGCAQLPSSPSHRVRGARKESDFPPSMAGAGADDDVVEVSCGGDGRDPGAYAAVLKRRLDLYCAAVAKSMVRFLLRQRSARVFGVSTYAVDRFGVTLVEFASSSISVISPLRFRDRNFIVNFTFWEI
jgi:hypothetical protein